MTVPPLWWWSQPVLWSRGEKKSHIQVSSIAQAWLNLSPRSNCWGLNHIQIPQTLVIFWTLTSHLGPRPPHVQRVSAGSLCSFTAFAGGSIPQSHKDKHREGEQTERPCEGLTNYIWNHLDDISHRIHGAGIYANIGGILMVNVTIYGYIWHTWILWVW